MIRPPDAKPLLSILIPAYGYADGIHRILDRITNLSPDECELIVYDDSPDDEVENVVVRWFKATGALVQYQRNQPSKGAVANWNALLDSARGEFCILMHHDEFPIRDSFIHDLVTTMRQHPNVDVLMLDCLLFNANNGRNRHHLPHWLRALVIKHFQHYLFRRNVIGPTAALVVRRSIYPRFDERLQWLVDVDVYVRMLKLSKRILLCPNIKIGSIMNRTDSITAQIGSSMPQIVKEERAYLSGARGIKCIWLGSYHQGESALYWLLSVIETMCWCLMRVATRIVARLTPCPVPLSAARRALLARFDF